VIKIDVLLGVAAATITLLGFFARAYSNWRSGTRIKRHTDSIRQNADRELERLQAEIDAARRTTGREERPGKRKE